MSRGPFQSMLLHDAAHDIRSLCNASHHINSLRREKEHCGNVAQPQTCMGDMLSSESKETKMFLPNSNAQHRPKHVWEIPVLRVWLGKFSTRRAHDNVVLKTPLTLVQFLPFASPCPPAIPFFSNRIVSLSVSLYLCIFLYTYIYRYIYTSLLLGKRQGPRELILNLNAHQEPTRA